MASILVVTSKVKGLVKPTRIGADALQALSVHVEAVLNRAAELSKVAKMETIKERHIKAALEHDRLDGTEQE